MESEIKPFLRWAGGKRWLSPKIAPLIKNRLQKTYIECFLGGGAVFFHVAPERAILSDINSDLINTYKIVKQNPDKLIVYLKKLSVNRSTYYKIRSSIPKNSFQQALRFIYLNRTCYGGLYRTNSQGIFNVPYGGGLRTPNPLWEKNILKNASYLLNKSDIKLIVNDFTEVINKSSCGDVVYCDPIYATVSREHFDRYNGQIFKWSDQVKLAKLCNDACQRGVLILISNVYCKLIKELYPKGYFICLERNKTIGNKMKNHKNGLEYLIILDNEYSRDYWKPIGIIE